MRIVMTTDTIGGVWTFTQELAIGLLEHGCDVLLFSLGRKPSRHQQAWANATRKHWGDRFCFHSADTPLEWMQENQGSYAEIAPMLARLIDGWKADVFHSSQFCFGAIDISIPKVVTAHSDVLNWAEACRTSPMEDTPWLRKYRMLVQQGLHGADYVTAPTAWMLKALCAHFDTSANRRVILNGRSFASVNGAVRKLQAVSVGRLWDEAKGFAILREISSKFRLIVAGEEGEGQTSWGAVELVGVLTEEELRKLFTESAIYICTSIYEPFGLAPLEAALCGCAVVARDIPSLREVWQDGALYFSDAESLSMCLQKLATDEGLLARAQKASNTRAQLYSRVAMTAQHLDLYREMTTRREELMYVA